MSKSPGQFRVCFPYKGDRLGGSHISSVYLAEELMRLGVDVRFLLHHEGDVGPYLAGRGHRYQILNEPHTVPKEYVGNWRYLAIVARAAPRIIGYLLWNRIDIVHTNCRDMHRTWAIPARISGTRHVWHSRGVVAPRTLERRLVGHCSAFIPISHYVLSTAPPPAAARAHSVMNPIYPATADRARVEAIRGEILDGRDGKIVGLFSRLDQKRKRSEFFADVARRVAETSDENVQFLVCGQGSRESIDRMTRKAGAYADRLHFRGFVAPVEPWMAAMDCIVAPAIREPLGRTPLEAAAVGVPVVASGDAGHCETVIENVTGILADKKDPQEFAAAILRVLAGALSGSGNSERRSSLLELYDPVVNAERVRAIYRTLAAR